MQQLQQKEITEQAGNLQFFKLQAALLKELPIINY